MEIKMINSPSTPTSPNADSAPSTVDGRQAEDDYDDETLIAIAVDRRSSNAIAAGEAIARRLTRLRRPIDLDQPPTPLAAGGIIDPPNLGIELDKPEALIAVSGRVVGSTHHGEQPVTSMARVGDRVEATLRGTLVDYDSELGHWTLETDGADHVPWQIKLHWGQPFRLSPEVRDVASLKAEVQRLGDENQRLRAHAVQLRKFAADLASAALRVSREPSWLN